mgnify:FL=1
MIQPIDLENSKYSYGTTPMYNSLIDEIIRRDSPAEIVMFNVATIIRNCAQTEKISEMVRAEKRLGKETDRPSMSLLNRTKAEISMLLNDIVEMFDANKSILNPTLIAYFCDYQKTIPSMSYRVPTPGKRVLTTAEQLLISSMTPKRSVTKVRNITLIEIPILNGEFPHKLLDIELGYIKNNHRIAHVTSHPLDYHICKSTSHYRLVQSFTGHVLKPEDLNHKVFGTDVLPFNIYTHAVLGDSVDIKSSISPGVKKKLIEVATHEHWNIHTPQWTKERLHEIGVRVPFQITSK